MVISIMPNCSRIWLFWDNYFDDQTEICTMDLTFFIKDDSGLYRRVRKSIEKSCGVPRLFSII